MAVPLPLPTACCWATATCRPKKCTALEPTAFVGDADTADRWSHSSWPVWITTGEQAFHAARLVSPHPANLHINTHAFGGGRQMQLLHLLSLFQSSVTLKWAVSSNGGAHESRSREWWDANEGVWGTNTSFACRGARKTVARSQPRDGAGREDKAEREGSRGPRSQTRSARVIGLEQQQGSKIGGPAGPGRGCG